MTQLKSAEEILKKYYLNYEKLHPKSINEICAAMKEYKTQSTQQDEPISKDELTIEDYKEIIIGFVKILMNKK